MKEQKIKKAIAWLAVILSLAISCFWSYWGIQEFFHEGWYSPSFGNLLFLFLVQYLSFAIVFTALALIAMKYKKAGLISYVLVGIFSAFFFNGSSFQVVYLNLAIPFVILGLLFYYGEFVHQKSIKWLMISLPLLIIVGFGTPLLIRNINRLDDGNYNARVLDCQGKQIVWAPRGWGFPDEGVNWSEAKEACSRLSADGQTLLAEEVNIWRLPSVEEAVKCQQKHGENAGGIWDEQVRQASYELMPDKETPLWQPDSEIIYYWTSEMSQETEKQAYIFTYDGKIYDKDIRYAPNYQSFRCVKDYIEVNLSENEILNQAEDVFVFQGEDNQDIENVLKKSFVRIKKMFDLDFSEKIEVFIYPTQTEFWVNAFPNNKNNERTVGFADHVNNKIYLTSVNDTSIKSREDMLKVPTHELVHILLPHSWIEIREGIAVYLADQILPYGAEDIPDDLANVIDYSGKPENTWLSYSFAGLKIKFIIEECLDNDYQKFLEFISYPSRELDYAKIGFDSEKSFLEDFRKYLLMRITK